GVVGRSAEWMGDRCLDLTLESGCRLGRLAAADLAIRAHIRQPRVVRSRLDDGRGIARVGMGQVELDDTKPRGAFLGGGAEAVRVVRGVLEFVLRVFAVTQIRLVRGAVYRKFELHRTTGPEVDGVFDRLAAAKHAGDLGTEAVVGEQRGQLRLIL